MMRLVLVLVLVSIASGAQAASDVVHVHAQPPSSPGSLVFVYDGSGAHVNGDRLRRALAAGLHRPVLRLTDDGAVDAVARLTVAFSPPDRWVIDFVRGELHTTRTVVLRSSTVARLARVAITIVADTEPPTTVARTGPTPRRGDWIALIGDEILDPFAGTPPISRRRGSLDPELVDPFATPSSARRSYDDVIDPWSR